jgi:hypothetical protein
MIAARIRFSVCDVVWREHGCRRARHRLDCSFAAASASAAAFVAASALVTVLISISVVVSFIAAVVAVIRFRHAHSTAHLFHAAHELSGSAAYWPTVAYSTRRAAV